MNKLLVGLAATVLAGNVQAATATSTDATTMVAPTSSASSISVPVATVAPTAKKVTLSYVAENTVAARAANISNWDGAVESQQHIGLAYNLGDDKTIQYRQYFHYNMTDASLTDETSIGDHVIQYTDATAAKIGDADMVFAARMYAPGTENNREVGKYELRLAQSVKQEITGKLSVEYALGTRLYTYSTDSSGQRGLRVLPGIAAEYKANNTLTPYVGAFTDHSWYNNGEGLVLFGAAPGAKANPVANTDTIYTDIGARVAVVNGINLNIYLENGKNLRSSDKYDLFNEANNSYNLEFSASM